MISRVKPPPIQAEKSRAERKALGSATLATKAVANAGPTPGSSSSRKALAREERETEGAVPKAALNGVCAAW